MADLQAVLNQKSAESAKNRTEHLQNSDLVALEHSYSPHMTLSNTFTSNQVDVATVKDSSGEIYGLWSLSHANTIYQLMQSPERYLATPVEMKWRMILKGIEDSIWDLLVKYVNKHIGHTWSNMGAFLAEATAMTRAFEGEEFPPLRGLTHCLLVDTHTILMNKLVTPAIGFVSSRINALRAALQKDNPAASKTMSNTVIASYRLRRPRGMVPKVYIEQLNKLADHANRRDQSAFSTDNPCFSQEAVARKAYEDLMELSEYISYVKPLCWNSRPRPRMILHCSIWQSSRNVSIRIVTALAYSGAWTTSSEWENSRRKPWIISLLFACTMA